VRPGGVMAGHDYINHAAVAGAQDWTLCEDGRHELGAVRRAVDEFAREQGVVFITTYNENGWPTWIMRKPFV
jgi:hypothetical protein